MQKLFEPSAAAPSAVPAVLPVNLAALTAEQLADLQLAPPAQLLIDCRWLPLPHPLGIGHFVTQLLQLQRPGTGVWLCNVHPVLSRCIHSLQLGTMFHLNG
ncbi:hypothetical protein [Hymenobacter cellulosilyticus]|uniref:STAS domain-containing protein n=1 Tax=Hymenobacter cellulosilyticus TaxID=2932248 RepID=A0A8T9QH31_9BACT|nr:hypothetical protein [Hymenobacter cellulosilyticus]UOQ74113.1 hypothetical protein MUN79_09595 [Hymenobacter cellulosilyticus]